MSFYGEDLSYVHHTGFTDLCDHAGTQVLAALKAAGIDSGLIVDLGCGSGVWAARAASAGYSVFGVDVSEPMLRLARSAAPAAGFRRSSLYTAEIPSCVAVTAFGEALNYGAPDAPTLAMLKDLFKRVSSSVTPGGLFVFDMLVGPKDAPMLYRTWSAGADYVVLVDVHESTDEPILHRHITVFRKTSGEHYLRSEENHILSLFDAHVVESLLVSAGFLIHSDTRYGDFELPPRRVSFFAHRQP